MARPSGEAEDLASVDAEAAFSVATEAPLSLLIPTYVLIGATVFFGIWTEPMLGVAKQAAELFLSVGGVQ